MNRAKFLTALVGGSVLLSSLACAETPEEKAIYDTLDAAVDAQFTYDFPRMVALLHPDSTKMFRNVQSAQYDQLVKQYSAETIRSVTGLPNHPKDLKLTDAEFFVAVCEQARKMQADFIGDPKNLPLAIHGTIFEGKATAYVVYSYSGSIHTTRTDFDYMAPSNMTFRKVGNQWLIHSSVLARRVSELWRVQCSKAKEAELQAKAVGQGAGNVRTVAKP